MYFNITDYNQAQVSGYDGLDSEQIKPEIFSATVSFDVMLDLSSVSGNGIPFNPSDTSNIEEIVKGFLSNFNFKKLY